MKHLCVYMRAPCRFCRSDWLSWLSAMRTAAFDAGMLPGQPHALRSHSGALPPADMRIMLIIASDGDISSMNLRNLGCFGPTNILSFPGTGGEVGTLFLSADTLERECILYGQEAPAHAIRLLAHGMGHILGFDHGPEMDEFCAYLISRALGECPDRES